MNTPVSPYYIPGQDPKITREIIVDAVKEVLGSSPFRHLMTDIFLNDVIGSDAFHARMRLIMDDAWNRISTDTAGMMRAASTLRSADFVMQNIPLHLGKTHHDLRIDAVQAAPADGLFMEFGVFKGYWINQMALARPEVTFHGFDSFEGLPEAWELVPAGFFSLQGNKPAVENNVELVKGWFNDTLPGFVAEHPGPVSFIHIDCDLYSSTMTLLDAFTGRFRVGTQIVLDDFMVAPGWEQAEHKAFFDYCTAHGIEFEYTGWSNQTPGCSAAVVLTKV